MNFKIGPITDSLIQNCAIEINKKETRNKIVNKIIEPLFYEFSVKCYRYYVLLIINHLIIIFLLIFIIFS